MAKNRGILKELKSCRYRPLQATGRYPLAASSNAQRVPHQLAFFTMDRPQGCAHFDAQLHAGVPGRNAPVESGAHAAPQGTLKLTADATVRDSGLLEQALPNAWQHNVQTCRRRLSYSC